MIKKYLIAMCLLVFASVVFADTQQTITVTINNIDALSKMVSFKYSYASPCPGQTCYEGGTNETDGIPASAPIVEMVQPFMQNIFVNPPPYVQPQGPYFIWFGTYNSTTQKSTFPASCEIMLNANQTINTLVIKKSGCVIS